MTAVRIAHCIRCFRYTTCKEIPTEGLVCDRCVADDDVLSDAIRRGVR